MHQPANKFSFSPCRSCGSSYRRRFGAEICIHEPGLANLDKLPILVYPQLLVCLDCGRAEFTVPATELKRLAKGTAADPPAA